MRTIKTTYCKRFDNSCYHHQCIANWTAVIMLQVLIIHIGLNVFEATDLYETLDLKFNPMDSSNFENNFKRTIICPTRANMNEPSKWMIYLRCSGDSRMKKVGSLQGQGKK